MEIEVKMNTEVYYELLNDAIKKSIELTKNELDSMRYYTQEQAKDILGYDSMKNFKRQIRKWNISYRRIGNNMFIHKEDINLIIDKYGRVDPKNRKSKVIKTV